MRIFRPIDKSDIPFILDMILMAGILAVFVMCIAMLSPMNQRIEQHDALIANNVSIQDALIANMNARVANIESFRAEFEPYNQDITLGEMKIYMRVKENGGDVE